MNNSTCVNPTNHPLCLPPVFYITVTSILGLGFIVTQTLNIGILTTFYLRRSLVTPFTVHIVNLIIINTVLFFGFVPLVVPRPLFPAWYNNNRTVCSFMQYFTWAVAALNPLQDLIICLDRWLAYLYPIWYRSSRTKYFGITATSIAVIYFHLWYLPLNILNSLMSVEDRRRIGCYSTLYLKYRFILYTAICILPQVIVYTSFPLLLVIVWKRRRVHVEGRAMAIYSAHEGRVNLQGPQPQRRPETNRETQLNARIRREEKVLNSVIVQFSMKLSGILIALVPTFLTVSQNPLHMLYCTWDSFYLTEYYLCVIYLAEPFVFLKMLPDLQNAFFDIFGCPWNR